MENVFETRASRNLISLFGLIVAAGIAIPVALDNIPGPADRPPLLLATLSFVVAVASQVLPRSKN